MEKQELEPMINHTFIQNCGALVNVDSCWLCGAQKSAHPIALPESPGMEGEK